MTLKKYLFVALFAVSAVVMTANTSSARLFGHGSHGSWGGGSWGGGSWGSRGSWGSHGSWGGSYGSGGSHGGYSYSNSCGSHGGYSASYGYDGGYGGYASSSNVIYGRVVSSRPVETVVASAPAIKTRLTLHVPADAKVTLAGVETKQAGEVREFATTRLAKGQIWQDYKVVVETTRDGQPVREERVIKLTGGQDQDLAVNFDSNKTDQVAQLTR